MVRTFGTVFLHVASLASILGLYFTIYPGASDRSAWHTVLLTIFSLAFVCFSLWEVISYFKNRSTQIALNKPQKIQAYMRRWLSHGGRAVIFTRDMSWAHSDETRKVLFEKAQRNELTICIQAPIQLTDELKSHGAEIYPYAELGHVPRSRFTIIDFERDGARVAVGGTVNGKHLIQEFESGKHPFFSVAEDLVKLLLALKRKSNVSDN